MKHVMAGIALAFVFCWLRSRNQTGEPAPTGAATAVDASRVEQDRPGNCGQLCERADR
jgi:hypothetical protein